MTDQDVWECDFCFEIFYEPRNFRHKAKIDDLEFDLCAKCYDKLMAFIKKQFETPLEEQEVMGGD